MVILYRRLQRTILDAVSPRAVMSVMAALTSFFCASALETPPHTCGYSMFGVNTRSFLSEIPIISLFFR